MGKTGSPPDIGIGRRSVTTATYILVARVVGLAANIVAVLLITRYLGKEVFGHYAFVMSYSLFIGTLATGGTFGILIRETSRDLRRAGENLSVALQVQMTFTIIAVAIAALLLPIFTHDPALIQAVFVSVLAAVIQILANLFASLFTAFEDTRYLAISVFIERGAFLAGIILVVWQQWSFLTIFWVQVTSFSLKLIFCASVVRLKFTRVVWRFDWERLWYFYRESLPLLFSTGFRTLDQQLDTFLLKLLQTPAELGLYGAPQRTISRMNIIPDSIMAGLLPALANLVQTPEHPRKTRQLYGKIFKYFLIISLPTAVVVTLLSGELMTLLFGADYADGAGALAIMVWVAVFMFPNYLFKYVLMALGKQQYETLSLAVSLAIHLGIGLWLIPRLGAVGAAVAMLSAQVVAFVIGYAYVTRSLGAYNPGWLLVKLAIGALPAAASIRLWPDAPALLQVLLAGGAYLLTLVLLRVFDRDEVALLLHILRRPDASIANSPPNGGGVA